MNLLTRTAEHDLFVRYRAGDRAAGDAIAKANLPTVEWLARKIDRAGNVEDMIAEGLVGLTIAMAKFDPDRGTRFVTYAKPWITTRMYLARVHRVDPVRIVGFAGRPDYYFKAHRALAEYTHGRATLESVAAELGKSVPEVEEAFAQMRVVRCAVHDEVLGATHAPTPEDDVIAAEIARRAKAKAAVALEGLDARELLIVKMRLMQDVPATLSEIGAVLGISRERVRQIETIALTKMRRSVQ